MNGRAPAGNWTGLFTPGEKVRLRFINGSGMSYFDVRIPGLKMTVVAADGLPVRPVAVDEFRIAVAETFDVIVEPSGQDAFTIFAQAMDRTGFAAGTLATRAGLSAPVPDVDPRPVLTMADMGHGGTGHDMGAMGASGRCCAGCRSARRPHHARSCADGRGPARRPYHAGACARAAARHRCSGPARRAHDAAAGADGTRSPGRTRHVGNGSDAGASLHRAGEPPRGHADDVPVRAARRPRASACGTTAGVC